MHKMHKSRATRPLKLTLLALALLLPACATPSMPVLQSCPANPPLPQVSTLQPQQSYSLLAAKRLQMLVDTLTDTHQTP